jgi:hypothetical protein
MKRPSRRSLLSGLALVTLAGNAAAQQRPAFAIGQEWAVPDLPRGHAFIGLIDEIDGRRVIHVSLLLNGLTEYGESANSASNYGHLAFTEEAFAASVGELEEASTDLPEGYRSDYARWQQRPFVIPIPIGQFIRESKAFELRHAT